ncbi:MAG: fluoride efflux transporter CrcB [Bacteroidia bacterium]|nr:fluoride efflux transporter CrcB [Bacteroidia bacterium]
MRMKLVLIALGGALGAVSRFVLSSLIQSNNSSDFPFGTFSVNILGCLFIGIVWASLSSQEQNLWTPFVMTGILGGFTTFSTFGLESIQLWQTGKITTLVAYVLLSNIVGLLAVLFGSKLYESLVK